MAEDKARKKKRVPKNLEKARKRAEGIVDAADVSDHEKAQQLRQVYKKASLGKKKRGNVEYVVAKKGEVRKRREETRLQFSSHSLCVAHHFICL